MKASIWLRFSVLLSCLLMIGIFLFGFLSLSHAQTPYHSLGPSGLPLPRFASIKPSRVNVRIGPGSHYFIVFTYQKQGLPIEIIQEYDQWRKIRDAEGNEGWIYQSLLSGKRTAITIPWQKNKAKRLFLRKAPIENAEPLAEIEPNVIGNIRKCDGHWCELNIRNIRGWLPQTQLWGIYPDEKLNN
ncbi:SH3 domain-containing protein [Bartonella sp. F02]|uniref:SH3 domain-containing protein n=1 Tax=Bartonella sp. F02 TaxID=2967262 RepID=UPI0022A94175|nr:SH3 domain-containing protein [Bartonella sp. F02]MCZ2328043.1 SH3 domain-containing protein [Bartonella sp. F02]